MEHEKWCVNAHTEGACSSKRGHWDRSTNTWDPGLTDKDRAAIAEGLRLWRSKETSMSEATVWVRENSDTLSTIGDNALLTWNMTEKRMAGMGRSWPV